MKHDGLWCREPLITSSSLSNNNRKGHKNDELYKLLNWIFEQCQRCQLSSLVMMDAGLLAHKDRSMCTAALLLLYF